MDSINLSVIVLSENTINSSSIYQSNSTHEKRNANSLCCRICHEDGSSGELIDPCECSGSLRLVHTSCLEKWLSVSNTDRCEICKFTYSIEKKNKPIHQSLLQWWQARRLYGSKGIVADFICLMVLTPLCTSASFLCGLGATTYNRLGIWESIGLSILSCMLMATYFLWLYITVRFHFQSWRLWCSRNQDVKVLVKHRAQNLTCSKCMKMEEDRIKRENEFIGTKRLLNWFDFNHRIDPTCNFQQQTTLV
ncbi:E3 ubiquitin-protein ligase MARCH3-like [Belonocnema kinseyi]|uniref:E3 ubiquitin-protein ligase MARCH3-like n=1 Tax=Belonocnema kinseyi TaxID=2817044 RepID=UPI00143DA0E9|nr:E3 ubiquitin-protein ligase MARCH3-like [Belonocnema kinseyi]